MGGGLQVINNIQSWVSNIPQNHKIKTSDTCTLNLFKVSTLSLSPSKCTYIRLENNNDK